MSLYRVFDIAGTGLTAQALRLNTTASNIANAESVSSNLESTYRGRHPVFVLRALGNRRIEALPDENRGSTLGFYHQSLDSNRVSTYLFPSSQRRPIPRMKAGIFTTSGRSFRI